MTVLSREKIRNFATVREYRMSFSFLCRYDEQVINVEISLQNCKRLLRKRQTTLRYTLLLHSVQQWCTSFMMCGPRNMVMSLWPRTMQNAIIINNNNSRHALYEYDREAYIL